MEKANHQQSATPFAGGDVEVSHVDGSGEDAYYVPKTKLRNVLYILMIGTGMLAGGAANGVISTTLAQPSFVRHMSLDGPDALALMGGTNGTFYAGGFFGVFFGAWASDRFGRRRALWVTGTLNIISCVLCASSVNIGMFIAVR
jgi:MFS family permease